MLQFLCILSMAAWRWLPLFLERGLSIPVLSSLSDIQSCELGALLLLLAFTSGRKRVYKRVCKLSLIAFAVYRAVYGVETSSSSSSLWGDSTASLLDISLLGRFAVVLEQLPSLFAGIPNAVDQSLPLRWISVSPQMRGLIKDQLVKFTEMIPWGKIILFLMDIVGVLFFFRLTKNLFVASNSIILSLRTPGRLMKAVKERGYNLVKDIPVIRKEIEKEQAKLEADLDQELKSRSRSIPMPKDSSGEGTSLGVEIPSPFSEEKALAAKGREGSGDDDDSIVLNRELPKKGTATHSILAMMRNETKRENVIWESGKVSGAVYHGGKAHNDLLNSAFSYYSIANPLHPDIWPSGMKFESEIISMTASLMNGGRSLEGTEICGCTSSGGTESIILAIKAARDYYRERKGIGKRGGGGRGGKPEVIACISAHAAVDKACDIMGLKLVQIPYDMSPHCNNRYQMDVRKTRAAITENTILIYSSAPSFAHGVIDPIQALGELALRYDVALHVDCCLGGFILPFARDEYQYRLAEKEAQGAKKQEADTSGEEMVEEEEEERRASTVQVPAFDFSVPGVSSMSVDTHKFGYTLKGTSVVLYKSKKMRQAQYFCYPHWSGGMYTTPTIAGSRSGGLISQCWASLMSIGYDGYRDNAVAILRTTRELAAEVERIPGIRLLGNSAVMIVCFASDDRTINTYSIADQMTKRGWSLNSLQNPPCVHLCVTMRHIGRTPTFVHDLKASLEDCRAAVHRGDKESGKAAIYGMASGMPTGPVEELLKCYNDVVLKI